MCKQSNGDMLMHNMTTYLGKANFVALVSSQFNVTLKYGNCCACNGHFFLTNRIKKP